MTPPDTRQPSAIRESGYQGSADPGEPTGLMQPQTRAIKKVEGLRRRVPKGTRVESRRRSVVTPCGTVGVRRWEQGRVIGHDSDLDLPLVRWERHGVEAVLDEEYEVLD